MRSGGIHHIPERSQHHARTGIPSRVTGHADHDLGQVVAAVLGLAEHPECNQLPAALPLLLALAAATSWLPRIGRSGLGKAALRIRPGPRRAVTVGPLRFLVRLAHVLHAAHAGRVSGPSDKAILGTDRASVGGSGSR